MRALVWHGTADIRCDTIPDPAIEDPRDAIVEVTSCAICGSDLHLFDHLMPGMKNGDIMGHETMGEVVEVGSEAKHKLKIGDRVVVPFTIIATVAACADDPKRIRTLAAFAFLAATSAADAFCAIGLLSEKGGRNSALADYRDRSGFPRGVEAVRVAARDFRPAFVSTHAEGAYLTVRPRPA